MKLLIVLAILLGFGAQSPDFQRRSEERSKGFIDRGIVRHLGTSGTVTANSPRALAQALTALTDEYGWALDYEEPPFYSKFDVVDVTAPEWRAAHPNEKGVTAIDGGAFQSEYPERPSGASVAEEEHVLDTIVSDYNRSGNPGQFRVMNEGNGRFAVVGTHVKDDKGQEQAVASILDTPITIPTETRNVYSTVEAITKELSANLKINVVPGMMPVNSVMESRVTIGGQNIPARSLLIQTLSAAEDRMCWNLYWGTTTKRFVLNLMPVNKEPSQAAN